MKIGIVLLEPTPRYPGTPLALLEPVLRLLPASGTHSFHTVRLSGARPNGTDLGTELTAQGIDVVLCNCPGLLGRAFPLDRQILYIPDLDHELHPANWTRRALRQRRRHWNQAVAEAGTLLVPTETVRQQLLRHDYTQCGRVLVMPPEPAQAAARLLSAFENAPAAVSPPIQVRTPPRVSIVTPSYNQGRFLRRTIESVLQQTYPHIEYRVCDGGSTDESVAILQSYGNRFPWVSARDRGQAHAINNGFATATGQLRAYLNSDDVLLPDAVEKAVRWFETHPACDMVYGHGLYIDEHDAPTGEYNTLDYSFERLMIYCIVSQPAAFWTTRIAQRIGEFDESLHFALDYDYWLRIDRAGGRIEHLPEPLACTRVYPQTKTMSGQDRFTREIIRVCLRSGGWVNFPAVQGYWYNRCFDQGTGWPQRCGKHGEKLPLLLARLHHVWLNRRTDHLGRAVHGLTRYAAILLRDQMRGLLRRAG